MAYETPRHLGRFQAASPFHSSESLDSRRGRPFDSITWHVRDDFALESDYTTIDVGGSALPADDETDGDSLDGPPDTWD